MNEKIYNEILRYNPIDEAEQKDKEAMLYFLKTNNDVLTRDNIIGHFTVSSWIFNKDKSKILMIYHNTIKSWAWIGGHADGDDNFKRVILKEIEEETGIRNVKFLQDEIYSLKIVSSNSHIKKGKYVSTHLHLDVEYVLEADESESVRIKEDENSGVKWIEISKLKDFVSEEGILTHYEKLSKKINIL